MPDPQEGTESRKSSSAEMKPAERYALRSIIPRIHAWHTATPPYCTYSKLEFVPSTSQRIPHTHTNGFGPLVPARPSRTAGLPREKAATPELQLRKHAAASVWGSDESSRSEGAGSTKPPSPIMMRAAMNQDQGRRKPTRRLPNHRRPRSSPVPTWRICRR